MIFWSYLALTFGGLLLIASALCALMARVEERRAIEAARKAEAHRSKNQERAAAILSDYHHVRACNCGPILGGAVLRLDARCVCWTKRLQEVAHKRNEPGANPARSALTVN